MLSTTQIFPLIILTLDAGNHMQITEFAEEGCEKGMQTNIMKEVWIVLLGIRYGNVVGANILGSVVNLPIISSTSTPPTSLVAMLILQFRAWGETQA